MELNKVLRNMSYYIISYTQLPSLNLQSVFLTQ